ncbi:hypothetical protein AMIS_19810 [Actinoplanes missouriensis 431]|uniref:Uncharacterized protein n=1 Tax=Actinoplanes missouriensis (strain ATCC 14538 / DSM 43046 / CBS 188.64 / JCM 3121 / NBRC 102363 / NCIMB 12654 / NRRL B-3342 / UNCC 431) TaxID=512565 RepID=I0H2G4_ACTM4|nr:hypothetical protein [Actinoplanes missouriensis]BAL87201.1 hypothetical protein AMIS_19810 [Actinoplanes missouriensis 431]
MPEITLTPTRAAVLRAVADGEVKHRRNWGREPDEDVWRPATGGSKKVNATVEWLRQVGLIVLGRPEHASMYAPSSWQLTEAGERWLAENEENT